MPVPPAGRAVTPGTGTGGTRCLVPSKRGVRGFVLQRSHGAAGEAVSSAVCSHHHHLSCRKVGWQEAEHDPIQPPAPSARPSWLRMLAAAPAPVLAALIRHRAGLDLRATDPMRGLVRSDTEHEAEAAWELGIGQHW